VKTALPSRFVIAAALLASLTACAGEGSPPLPPLPPPRPPSTAPVPGPPATPAAGAPLRAVPPARRSGRIEAAVPFGVGEVLDYDVSWSSFVTAGTATLVVAGKNPSAGSLAYTIMAEGQSTALVSLFYPVHYKADTLLDAYDLVPRRGSIAGEEKGVKKTRTVLFDQPAHKARFELRTTTTSTSDFKVPPGAQDALSAFYWLRSYPLRAGGRFLVPIVFNGTVVPVQVTVSAREQVRSRVGTMFAWRLTPVVLNEDELSARKMSLWISDDGRRLPLRMQVELPLGSFDFTLTAARKAK